MDYDVLQFSLYQGVVGLDDALLNGSLPARTLTMLARFVSFIPYACQILLSFLVRPKAFTIIWLALEKRDQ